MRFGRFDVADSAASCSRTASGPATGRSGRAGAERRRRRALEREGVETVVGARIEAGDVTEDVAAQAAAQALAGSGVRVGAPFTGRCNVFAAADGLLLVSAPDVDRFNAVDEALTVATLPGPRPVHEGEMLATIKVIPFAVPGEVLERALAGLGPAPAIRVAAFEPMDAALIQTRLPATKETVLDKTSRVLRSRIETLNGRIVEEVRCPHDAGAVALAVDRVLEAGARLVLVVGASAIADRRDVIPGGIVAAGGEVLHLGMPVDPGNLLLLGRCRGRSVLGLPGCARSPKLNGLDLVLERPRRRARRDAARRHGDGRRRPAQGDGGARPAPARLEGGKPGARCERRRPGAGGRAFDADGAGQQAPRAARRTGDGACGGRRTGGVVRASRRRRHRARGRKGRGGAGGRRHPSRSQPGVPGRVERIDAGPGSRRCRSPRRRRSSALATCRSWRRGTSTSWWRRSIPPRGARSAYPSSRGSAGNPVLFARRFFAEMAAIRGDVGARHLIGEYEEYVCEVAMDDRAVLLDVDSPRALAGIGEPL